ncbi:hypothetical protein CEXT_77941 [Caerostris extrusa]|uniref:Uncharacterized protein n=1 Tax=Caerostris extrusa TaxID=172846 RepID=A0AAV4N6D7_CAEEX|nr:hypothetical protein CEXT_77941 [Caerostris extrusa]
MILNYLTSYRTYRHILPTIVNPSQITNNPRQNGAAICSFDISACKFQQSRRISISSTRSIDRCFALGSFKEPERIQRKHVSLFTVFTHPNPISTINKRKILLRTRQRNEIVLGCISRFHQKRTWNKKQNRNGVLAPRIHSSEGLCSCCFGSLLCDEPLRVWDNRVEL